MKQENDDMMSLSSKHQHSFLQHLAVDDVLLRVFEFIDCSSLVRTGTSCHRFRELSTRSAEQRTHRLADGRQSSISTLSDIMSEASDPENVTCIEELTSELKNLTTTTSGKNVTIGGVSYGSDVLQIHTLIKNHKLIYSTTASPCGKWQWSGLREIKKRGGEVNPTFALPDGVSTFYGSLAYDYSVNRDQLQSVITHDVISCSSIFLDVKARNAPRNAGSGVYGVDWWNVYMPLKLLEKLSTDIKQVTGYILNEEGVIVDKSQGLASITVNVKDESDSPAVTMITIVEAAAAAEEETEEDESVIPGTKELKYTDMGTLKDIMDSGGEEALIGGVGFFTVGISCKGTAGEDAPPAGTTVKLSLKMKGFHALHVVESGIRRIKYKSATHGLKY